MSQRGLLLVSLFLLSSSLAGCLGDDATPAPDGPDDGDPNGGTGGTDGTDGGLGTDGNGVTGSPPTAIFEVVAEGDVVAGANVTFNASASADPDGTNLTFAWDFGDGATGEGVAVMHVYAEPGNYTVVLNVTDGEGATAETNQTVVVAAGGPPAFDETLSGSIAAPNPALLVTPSGSNLATYRQRGGVEDTTYQVHELPEVPLGATGVSFELVTTTQYVQFVLFDGDGNQLAQRNFPTGGSKITLTGDAAQHGHYFVFVYSAAFANAAYEIEVGLE